MNNLEQQSRLEFIWTESGEQMLAVGGVVFAYKERSPPPPPLPSITSAQPPLDRDKYIQQVTQLAEKSSNDL